MTQAASGCGGASCGCGGHEARPRPSVNEVFLIAEGERVGEEALRERAWSELLRQEAVRRGLLPAHGDAEAPGLSLGDQLVVEGMLDEVADLQAPSDEECRRYYEARQPQFVEGAQVHARHILFAVTPGVDVQKLAARAEQALLSLTYERADFAELARELSNCPSGADGGDLGWFGPRDCAAELAADLFHGVNRRSLGLRPRLVHSRYGLHIVEVLERRAGTQAGFEQVRGRIGMQLAQQARARALHQFMQLLAGQARIEGVALDRAESPLVQ